MVILFIGFHIRMRGGEILSVRRKIIIGMSFCPANKAVLLPILTCRCFSQLLQYQAQQAGRNATPLNSEIPFLYEECLGWDVWFVLESVASFLIRDVLCNAYVVLGELSWHGRADRPQCVPSNPV